MRDYGHEASGDFQFASESLSCRERFLFLLFLDSDSGDADDKTISTQRDIAFVGCDDVRRESCGEITAVVGFSAGDPDTAAFTHVGLSSRILARANCGQQQPPSLHSLQVTQPFFVAVLICQCEDEIF